MNNLILIRGIPGSGKSTIANLMSVDVVLEADLYFEKHAIQFDKSKVKDAHKWCAEQTETAMKNKLSIAVANTFVEQWEMQPYFDLAAMHDYQVHSIIVENRHGNSSVHGVPIEKITNMVNRFQVQLTKDLYNDLVRIKTYDNGLSIHKYSRKVFYNNLWNSHPDLVYARGTVYDNEGNIVQLPFTKIFNRRENGIDIHRDHTVTAFEKVNGFMACVTLYNDEILVSTTGSLDSDYVQMAKEKLPLDTIKPFLSNGISFCYEIVHENDPHIIPETPGAYLIGGRVKIKGSKQIDIYALQTLAEKMGVMFPKFCICKFSDVVNAAKTSKIEGWVVYDHESDTVLKIKTPYYLVSKFIARTKKMDSIFNSNYKAIFDEEYYSMVEYIRSNYTKETFSIIPEQERLLIIREYFINQY